ncbi:MAG: hypothetical protein E3K37_05265 [Candidatus Kuenenia sp.]|nr:hypothetical protein [Candidatus Kuenenia hertensis]
MLNDARLDELVDIVKKIGKIYDDEGMNIEIDFDPNDGIILIKYLNTASVSKTYIINSGNKTISGIDTTKLWLPDYSKEQKAGKKLIHFLQSKGYTPSNIRYRKNETKKKA